MSDWKEVKLGDEHIDLISGYAFKSKNFLESQEEGTLPVIKIKNVANGDVNLIKVVYHAYDESLIKFKLSKGDVLIAMTGNHPTAKTQVVGDVSKYKLNEESLLNQRVGKIISKGENNLDFFYYFFKDKDTHRYLANQSSGSANQANISKANILNIETKVPEPEEQKAIASVLSSLDDKIDLLHRQNKILEAMAETLFREWFVEGADVNWEQGVLGDLANVDTGFSFKSKEYTENGTLRVVRGKNVTIGTIRWGGDTRYWDFPTDKLEKYLLNKREIVIGMDGSRIGQNRSLILETDLPAILAQRVARVRAKNFSFQPFIWTIINSDDFVNYIRAIHTGTSIPHISQSQILNYELIIPNSESLQKFSNTVHEFWDKIENNKKQIRSLENLRNTLLPKLISGEIRLPANE